MLKNKNYSLVLIFCFILLSSKADDRKQRKDIAKNTYFAYPKRKGGNLQGAGEETAPNFSYKGRNSTPDPLPTLSWALFSNDPVFALHIYIK